MEDYVLSTDWFILLSSALSFGAPLAWAWYDLRSMKRPPRSGGGGDGNVTPEPVRPILPGDDDLPPLPPSLIPDLDAGPVRGPEPAKPQRVLEPA
ncbi:MAG: hypothetical protein AAFX81_21315 [Pseudomonadota bacterium]